MPYALVTRQHTALSFTKLYNISFIILYPKSKRYEVRHFLLYDIYNGFPLDLKSLAKVVESPTPYIIQVAHSFALLFALLILVGENQHS